MIGKNQIKVITGLHQKKFRAESGLFIAEGPKVIQELLDGGFTLEKLYCTADFPMGFSREEPTLISESELKKISALTTPNKCLAVFKIPSEAKPENEGLIVALDDIRDPGNLGTIIRLCDWFGVKQIICSKGSVDVYNPKVVQATMGSLARVQINYLDLAEYFSETKLPVFGTFMDGQNIYQTNLPSDGIVVFGNESNGISQEIEKAVTVRISIPRFGDLQKTESLNVATSAAIVLSEFRRS